MPRRQQQHAHRGCVLPLISPGAAPPTRLLRRNQKSRGDIRSRHTCHPPFANRRWPYKTSRRAGCRATRRRHTGIRHHCPRSRRSRCRLCHTLRLRRADLQQVVVAVPGGGCPTRDDAPRLGGGVIPVAVPIEVEVDRRRSVFVGRVARCAFAEGAGAVAIPPSPSSSTKPGWSRPSSTTPSQS